MSGALSGRRVLVIEDQYLIAQDMCALVRELGGDVAGPVGRVSEGLDMIDGDGIDLVLLDVNLAGQMIFPVAVELKRRSVPFIFATGYDAAVIPPELTAAPRVEKPVTAAALVAALKSLESSTRN